ncbi:leucine-rich repeat protein [Tanacetum coccineum]
MALTHEVSHGFYREKNHSEVYDGGDGIVVDFVVDFGIVECDDIEFAGEGVGGFDEDDEFGCDIPMSTVAASYDGNETDHQALLSFKSMLRYPNGVLSSWNDSFHFCDWSGISCGKRHRRVTVIKLKSQGLEGSLSPHVGNLSFLRVNDVVVADYPVFKCSLVKLVIRSITLL